MLEMSSMVSSRSVVYISESDNNRALAALPSPSLDVCARALTALLYSQGTMLNKSPAVKEKTTHETKVGKGLPAAHHQDEGTRLAVGKTAGKTAGRTNDEVAAGGIARVVEDKAVEPTGVKAGGKTRALVRSNKSDVSAAHQNEGTELVGGKTAGKTAGRTIDEAAAAGGVARVEEDKAAVEPTGGKGGSNTGAVRRCRLTSA